MMDKLIYLPETTSTNVYLKDLSSKMNVKEATTIFSEFQTGGKGQRGNMWESDRNKNLLFSLLLRPQFIQANEQFLISQLVSLAIKNVLDRYMADVTIKWSNDIYWRDKKICGILIENNLEGSRIIQSIVGIGLNVNQEVFLSNAPNPTSLKLITGEDHHLLDLLSEVKQSILSLYEQAKTDREAVVKKYKESLYRKNGLFLYEDKHEAFYAEIEDVDATGILTLVTESKEYRKYAFKEVKFLM